MKNNKKAFAFLVLVVIAIILYAGYEASKIRELLDVEIEDTSPYKVYPRTNLSEESEEEVPEFPVEPFKDKG